MATIFLLIEALLCFANADYYRPYAFGSDLQR
jgi:hypothetical protein